MSIDFFISIFFLTVEWSSQSDFEIIDGQQLITDIRHLSCVIPGLEKVKILLVINFWAEKFTKFVF